MSTTWVCNKSMRDAHRKQLNRIIEKYHSMEENAELNRARDSLTLLDEFERVDGLIRALYPVLSQANVKDRKSLELAINAHFGLTP
jgi:hypothetical protein